MLIECLYVEVCGVRIRLHRGDIYLQISCGLLMTEYFWESSCMYIVFGMTVKLPLCVCLYNI